MLTVCSRFIGVHARFDGMLCMPAWNILDACFFRVHSMLTGHVFGRRCDCLPRWVCGRLHCHSVPARLVLGNAPLHLVPALPRWHLWLGGSHECVQTVPRWLAITARLHCLRAGGRLHGAVPRGHVCGVVREHFVLGLPARHILDSQGRYFVLELPSRFLVAARSDIVL